MHLSFLDFIINKNHTLVKFYQKRKKKPLIYKVSFGCTDWDSALNSIRANTSRSPSCVAGYRFAGDKIKFYIFAIPFDNGIFNRRHDLGIGHKNSERDRNRNEQYYGDAPEIYDKQRLVNLLFWGEIAACRKLFS